MRRLLTLTAVAATLLVAAGCGSSGSTANKTDVEAVVASVSNGSTMTRKQATCIAEAAVPKLSKQGLTEAKKKPSDLSKLSKSDQTAVFDAFTSCVTVAQLSPEIAKEFESGSGKVASKSEKCYESTLAGKYDKSGDLMRAAINDSSKFAKSLAKCVSSDALKKALVQAMTSSGLTQAQASCAADKILSEVSASDLESAGTAATLPADVQAKIQAATTSCQSAK